MSDYHRKITTALQQHNLTEKKLISHLTSSIQQLNRIPDKPSSSNNAQQRMKEIEEKMLQQYLMNESAVPSRELQIEKSNSSLALKTILQDSQIKIQLLTNQLNKEAQQKTQLQRQIEEYMEEIKRIEKQIVSSEEIILEKINDHQTKVKDLWETIDRHQLNSQQFISEDAYKHIKQNNIKAAIPSIINQLNKNVTFSDSEVNHLQSLLQKEELKYRDIVVNEADNEKEPLTLERQIENLKNNINYCIQEIKWKQEDLKKRNKEKQSLLNPKNVAFSRANLSEMEIEGGSGKSTEYWHYVHGQAMKRVSAQVKKEDGQINKLKKAVKVLWNFIKQVNDENLKNQARDILTKFDVQQLIGIVE